MEPTREQYEAWLAQHREINATVNADNRDWVAAATAFTSELERDCSDANVNVHANGARLHAAEFASATRTEKVQWEYSQFLRYWQRLPTAIGRHVVDRKDRS